MKSKNKKEAEQIPPVETKSEPQLTSGEEIWKEIKDKKISVFTLPAQPVHTLLATKKIEQDNTMVQVPDVICTPDMVLFKLKFSAGLASLSEAFPKFNFNQAETGHVMVTRKTEFELLRTKEQPFVVINR